MADFDYSIFDEPWGDEEVDQDGADVSVPSTEVSGAPAEDYDHSIFDETWENEPQTVEEPENDRWQITRGLLSGVDSVQAMGYGAAALVGDAVGADSLQEWGMEGYQRNMAEASENPPSVKFTDIDSVSDFGDWALYTGGTLLPTMGEALVGGVIGSAIAPGAGTAVGAFASRTVLKKAIGKMAKDMVEKQAARKLAGEAVEELTQEAAEKFATNTLLKKLGSHAGVVGATTQMEGGGNYGESVELLGEEANPYSALAFGFASGMLELAGGNIRFIDKVLGADTGKLFKKALDSGDKKLVGRIALEAAKQAPAEAAQEMGQEFLSMANLAVQDKEYEIFSPENIDALIEAGAAGALAGVGFGATTGLLTKAESIDDANRIIDQEIQNKQKENAVNKWAAQQKSDQEAGDTGLPGAAPTTGAQVVPESDPETAPDQPIPAPDGQTATNPATPLEEKLVVLQGALDVATDPESKAGLEAQIAEVQQQIEAEPKKSDRPLEPTTEPIVTNEVDQAAHEASSSTLNDLNEPSEAQISAGNYKKGHIKVAGLDISVENPQGSTRSGVSPEGEAWSNTMTQHYGYVKRTEGADGDQVDVFVKPGTNASTEGSVFIVNQRNQDGSFDEHKALIGYGSMEEAVAAYESNYGEGWNGNAGVAEMSFDQFKGWLDGAPKNVPADGKFEALEVGQEKASVAELDESQDIDIESIPEDVTVQVAGEEVSARSKVVELKNFRDVGRQILACVKGM